MQSTVQSDAPLSKRVQTAYEILEKHKDIVQAAINSQINNTMEADDIFQDFFLSLVDKPIPEGLENVQGYLRRAIRNDIVDEARRFKSHKEQLRGYTQHKMTTARKDAPPAVVEQAELMSKVFAAINSQLFHCEAQVVLERYYHNHNADQTAEAMGINKRTVSRYLCIGLKKIRKSLDDDLSDNDSDVSCHAESQL